MRFREFHKVTPSRFRRPLGPDLGPSSARKPLSDWFFGPSGCILSCVVDDPCMLDPATSQSPKHRFLTSALAPHQPKQRRLMVAALMLLLISLGIVLYRDRDFWFPDTE